LAAPLVIAHRGASGHLPEHTLAAYDLAIAMGADFVEPDLVSTRDSVLVARHENEIGATTDAAARFPARRRTRTVDGRAVTGWFVEDFTLAELRTLRARERVPTRSRARDGEFPVPTFDEVLALVARRAREAGRPVGVYPETKHPEHFRALGLPLEERLAAALRSPARAGAPVFVQSFSAASLRRLRPLLAGVPGVKLVQLVRAPGSADDVPPPHDRPGALATPAGLAFVRGYADALGPDKALVQPVDSGAAALPPATALVADAHRAGLRVHVWTLRGDAPFLPAAYRGDPLAEWRRFAALGVDGIFGDSPDQGRAALGPPR
jgi:glycerophosphoryl diester phosphodiesterase